MPPAKLGLVYSHTGLRRFLDAIGAARTRELFLLGSYIDAAHGPRVGARHRVAAPEALERTTLELAASWPATPRSRRSGNKRVIAALLAAEGELPEEVEEELIELRRASFASRGHAGGDARLRRAPPARAGAQGRRRASDEARGARLAPRVTGGRGGQGGRGLALVLRSCARPRAAHRSQAEALQQPGNALRAHFLAVTLVQRGELLRGAFSSPAERVELARRTARTPPAR